MSSVNKRKITATTSSYPLLNRFIVFPLGIFLELLVKADSEGRLIVFLPNSPLILGHFDTIRLPYIFPESLLICLCQLPLLQRISYSPAFSFLNHCLCDRKELSEFKGMPETLRQWRLASVVGIVN